MTGFGAPREGSFIGALEVAVEGKLVGWGYQGRSLDDLVTDMRASNACRLVDVRLTPVSRVKGFSKGRLRERLESEGLAYEHRPELGNPKDNRPGYAFPGTPAADRAHLRFYHEVIDSPAGAAAIGYLAGLVDAGEVVFVLCFESGQACCHRAQVINAVKEIREEGRFTRDFDTDLALAG